MESLKAARERVAEEIYDRACEMYEARNGRQAIEDIAGALRELQLQAMEALLVEMLRRDVYRNGWVGGQTHVLDALLDVPAPEPQPFPEPPPHHPPRCIHCGGHEPEHAVYSHAFEPQSPRCHRAHPHPEPCV